MWITFVEKLWAYCGHAVRLFTGFHGYPRIYPLRVVWRSRNLDRHVKASIRGCSGFGQGGNKGLQDGNLVSAGFWVAGLGGGFHVIRALGTRAIPFRDTVLVAPQRGLRPATVRWRRVGVKGPGFGTEAASRFGIGRGRQRPRRKTGHASRALNDLCPGCVQRKTGGVIGRFQMHGAWPAPRGVRVRCLGGALAGFPGPASLTPLSLIKGLNP